jgi:hypothetical protein
MVDSHWICYDTGKPFEVNLDKFGFVYIITNTKSGKAYVGCKQYFSMGKKKTKHKWETYMSSSKYLKADIKKIGKKHFTFEVIAEYKNKRSLRYYEAYYQMKWNVLTATMEDSDDPAYYNSYVGGKWYRPIESYQDPEWKRKNYEHLMKHNKGTAGEKHHFHKGKAEFYLDGKRMVVDCLGAWANKNGYDGGNIHQIARTTKDGFYKSKYGELRGYKVRAFSSKGPLGTVTKVKYLGKEINNVNQESNV